MTLNFLCLSLGIITCPVSVNNLLTPGQSSWLSCIFWNTWERRSTIWLLLFPVSAVRDHFFVDIEGESPRKWQFARMEKMHSSAFDLFVNTSVGKDIFFFYLLFHPSVHLF